MLFGPKMMAGANALDVSKLFKTSLWTGSAQTISGVGFQPDLVWLKSRDSIGDNYLTDSVRGPPRTSRTNSADAEYTAAEILTAFNADGFTVGNNGSQNWVGWSFKRAARFFDIVTWTGNGDGSRRIDHGLGVVPGLIIAKRRDTGADWAVSYVASASEVAQNSVTAISLNKADAPVSGYRYANDPSIHSASQIHLNTGYLSNVNQNGQNVSGGSYMALLFANDPAADGVIKCGTFDGTVNTVVNLGREPQFLMFRNLSGGDHWRIVDAARGMPTGAPEKQLLVSSPAAESDNELVDITSTGFRWRVSAAGNEFLYVAILKPSA